MTGIAGYHYTIQNGKCQKNAQGEPSFFFLDRENTNIFFISIYFFLQVLRGIISLSFSFGGRSSFISSGRISTNRKLTGIQMQRVGIHRPLFGESQTNKEVEADGLHRIVYHVPRVKPAPRLAFAFTLKVYRVLAMKLKMKLTDVGDGVGCGSQTVITHLWMKWFSTRNQ